MTRFTGLRSLANYTLTAMLNRLPVGTRLAIRQGVQISGRLDHSSVEITLAVDTPMEYFIRLRSCQKEPETVSWIENDIWPGDVMYDVGANIGAYSLLTARLFAGQVQVFSFEPGFFNFNKLSQNVIENKCSNSITPIPIAFSDSIGLHMFTFSNISPGAADHCFAVGSNLPESARPRLAVMTYRMDEWIHEFAAPFPAAIKIDVDGGELGVVRGAARTLADPRMRTVLIEVGPATEGPVCEALIASGFEISGRYQHNQFTTNYTFRRRA